ncbi:lysine--tRNA ligase [Allorhizobium taibaishanense]|uniref:Lysine--tRNA ligase n=1 Tax=Allorhizobium taibaishanense TaxID=887144 RepID=A0A1Q9A581_9HYPH|nr:lysine--tRNA ligase [Allorhizobium taibaishanense]MBB4006810.1 lysyl-tRNA synthetase class 2 [Allorhizobium taibaishanense]OLP49700.1 lysine--tRNA ligase [Allorhizobium taibaishanense]
MSEQKTETALSSDATEVRRQKLALLREQIGDVYPAHFHRTATTAELAEKYAELAPDTESGDTVTVAGRIYSSRNSGMFMDLRDASGKIQIFSHKDTTPEEARAMLPMIDLGDIVGVTGQVRRTKRGELTINAQEITMLTKTLLPMPEKYHGVTDIEVRYRKRHLDILTNEESKLRFQQRSKIVSGIRRFMESDGFMEVETPMLQSIYGGASADPFKTHHNTLKQDMYLRIAPELFLKRTLVSGLSDKIFEINRNFRNEGVSTRHNPEFTMMECYWAYADYEDIMDLVERLFAELALAVHGSTEFAFGDKEISFKGPFKRVPMPDAVKEATGIDFLSLKTDEEARAAAKAAGFEVEKDWTWGECLSFIFEEKVEGTLIQPSHVTHFPKDISPFAKEVPGEPRLVERFETYCNAWEIGNAFSELNDPEEQRKRMVEQLEQAHARGEKDKQLDDEFLDAMDQGMPPAGGLGIGVDRVIMLLTNAPSIRDIILFPARRAKAD